MCMKRFYLGFAIMVSILTSSVNVKAQNYTDSSIGNPSVTVNYSQASTFTVVLPESLNIDEGTKTGSFEVYLSDYDLAGDKAVSITTDSEVILEEQVAEGVGIQKDDVTATVVFPDTKLHDDTRINGTISAEDLSAGKWKGTMTFEISLQDRD